MKLMSNHYVSTLFAKPQWCLVAACDGSLDYYYFFVNGLTRFGALRTALQFVWNRLAVGARLLWRLQPVEPLLLKMESRLSLFTIWRPDCSLCYPTAILPALKIQLWERRGPCKWQEVHVRSLGGLSRSEAPRFYFVYGSRPAVGFLRGRWARLPVIQAAARTIV